MPDSPDLTVKCPGCDLKLPANAGWAQKRHMERHHPEIIAERLTKAGLIPPRAVELREPIR